MMKFNSQVFLYSCPWCGTEYETRLHKWECFIEHFEFYAPNNFQYWRGNIKAFGFVDGLLASIALTFPFTTIFYPSHWKHRKDRLIIGGKK